MTQGNVTYSLSNRLLKNVCNLFLAASVAGLLMGSPISLAASTVATDTHKTEMVASKVDINKATAQQIAEILSGVGLKKAEAIVAYRRENGSFKSLEQLLNVKGIGEATLNTNKSRIQL